MLYVTGDMHGYIEKFGRRKVDTLLKREDTLFVAGNLGSCGKGRNHLLIFWLRNLTQSVM